MIEAILANAALVRTFARDKCDAAVDYDDAGVRWLAAYIDGPAQQLDDKVKEKMRSMFGSYLGECIRQTYGGKWVEDQEQGWALEIVENFRIYPFNKVSKHLDQLEGASVHGLFSAIGPMLDHHRNTPAPPPTHARPAPQTMPLRRPWWKVW